MKTILAAAAALWTLPLIAACPTGTTAHPGIEVYSGSSCTSGTAAPGYSVTEGACTTPAQDIALPTGVDIDTNTVGTWQCTY